MLNYRQLYYFWRVAKDGGITRASERLHLTPQTLSGQISQLEDRLGLLLFRRVGRRLELSEMGRLALSYADDIFRAGEELEHMLRTSPGGRPHLLRVGLADALPKSIAHHMLAPAMALDEPVHLICREDRLPRLLGELATHRLDVVLADSPLPADAEVKGHSHLLVECSVTLLARPELARTLRGDFPACLDGAPFLIPGEGAAMRGRLIRWFRDQILNPRIVGEFDDSALMRAFGQEGRGIYPVPALIAAQMCQQDGLVSVGSADTVIERFYAISVARRVSHPAVLAILDTANRTCFTTDGGPHQD